MSQSKITVDRIHGLDDSSASTDLKKEFATVLKNFSTTKKPGLISKTGTYTEDANSLIGSSFTSGLTIKNMTELNLTQPSEKSVYLFHVQNASNENHLYIGEYYDGSSFQSGLQQITEHISTQITLTATDISSGTDADKIVVDSSNGDYSELSETDDYYNGQIITIDIASASVATSAKITDYTYDSGAGTKTLTVTSGALTGIAASDAFYISKYPVVSYDSSGSDLAGIANVDDIIRFMARENLIIGMTGNSNQFPTQYQLWYGFINNRRFGDSSSSETYTDFWFDIQQMLSPAMSVAVNHIDRSILSATKQSSAGSTIDQEVWEFKTAYEYDNFQIGPLSREDYFIDLSGGASDESLRIYLHIPYNACYDSSTSTFRKAYESRYESDEVPGDYSGHLLSRRITGVYVFVKNTQVTGSDFKFLKFYRISGNGDELDLGDDEILTLDSDGMLKISGDYTEYTSDPSVGDTYETTVAQTGLQSNFTYGVSFEDHTLIAKLINKHGNKRDNFFAASTIENNGATAFDSFGSSNQTNLGFYGQQKITGLAIVGDIAQTTSPKRRLLVFSESNVFILQITTGSSFSYSLDKIEYSDGCVAPASIVSGEDFVFYVSQNGMKIFSGMKSFFVDNSIKNTFQSFTTITDAIAGYHKNEKLIVCVFPTEQKSYAFDLINNYQIFELDYNDTFSLLMSTKNGELYSSDGTDIFKLESGTTQNSSYIIPNYKSKKFTALDFGFSSDDEIIPIEGYVRYKSDTAINLKAYLDGNEISFNNLSLPAKTFEDDVKFKFPLSLRGKEIEIEVNLTTTQSSTNTSFEFNRYSIIADQRRRI